MSAKSNICALVAATAVAGAAFTAVPAASASAHDLTARHCDALEPSDVAVDVTGLRGDRARVDVELVGAGPFCDDTVHVRSLASAGPDVGPADPAADRPVEIPLVGSRFVPPPGKGALVGKQTGARAVSNVFETDPCWAGIEVHLEDGTPLFEQVLGDGCEMTVVTDFWVDPHSADIHVVQQTGNIQPPHIWTVLDDDTTVLTGLPSGTWYVKVFDGWTPNSDIAVDGGTPVEQSTVYDVEDGSLVEITLWPEMDPT